MYKSTDKVFIVCTGSSLTWFDFNKLKCKNVIAVNEAIMNVDAQYMVAIDFKSVFDKPEYVPIIKDTTVIVDSQITSNLFNILVMERGSIGGFDFRHNRVATASNSGYMAINAAYHLGARNIYLLGMDMGKINGERYFYHKGYKEKPGEHTSYNYVLPYFDELHELTKDVMNIYNCSEHSLIDCFTKIKLEDVKFD